MSARRVWAAKLRKVIVRWVDTLVGDLPIVTSVLVIVSQFMVNIPVWRGGQFFLCAINDAGNEPNTSQANHLVQRGRV